MDSPAATQAAANAPYAGLTPDCVLDALDSVGLRRRRPPARAQQLREPRLPGLARGRRAAGGRRSSTGPGAGATTQILEEHAFAQRARRARDSGRRAARARRRRRCTDFAGFRFAVYPGAAAARRSSSDRETLEWMGRFIGRIHAVGALRAVPRTGRRSTSRASATSRATVCSTHGFIPADLQRGVDRRRRAGARRRARAAYERAGAVATAAAARRLPRRQRAVDRRERARISSTSTTRAWGPAVQDLWMLLSGERAEMTRQLADVLAGYEDFREFDRARTAPDRGAAHAAPDPLLGLARAALGRSGVPGGRSLVQHPALLAGPHPGAARADRADGRAAARGVNSGEPVALRAPAGVSAGRRRPGAASGRCARRARDRG